MPIFEYCCRHCGLKFEQMRKSVERDEPLAFSCKRCGEYELFRVPGIGGFHLKGFCWSRDNYSRTVGDDPRGHFQKEEDFD